MDTTETPLACNLAAFTPEQRARHHALGGALKAACLGTTELEGGYRFRYPGSALWLLQLAEFVTLERVCCPFFSFTLEVTSGERETSLSITGSPQAKALLALEMVA